MLHKFKGATFAALTIGLLASAPAQAGISAVAPVKSTISAGHDVSFDRDRKRDRKRSYARDQRVEHRVQMLRRRGAILGIRQDTQQVGVGVDDGRKIRA